MIRSCISYSMDVVSNVSSTSFMFDYSIRKTEVEILPALNINYANTNKTENLECENNW